MRSYPGAENLEEFWRNLEKGENCVGEIQADRWDWREHYDPDRAKQDSSYSRWGGFLTDVDKFDSLFFNITPSQAEGMDPQERIFLETVWHTLEDAGYSKTSLAGSKTAVFAGIMNSDYQSLAAERWALKGKSKGTSNYWSVANRVSYFFDWRGPSMAVDTACSSSLSALHLACLSLKQGECDLAVAGGVNLILHPLHMIKLCSFNMLSSGAENRSFGAGGDGFTAGEGVGTVLLKPLEKALKDGDRIYGVIKGSQVNSDGKTGGYTVPNPLAQGELIRQSLESAEIKADSLGYVEAHGTGTSLGDPIEIGGLKRAFEKDSSEKQYCSIGSVKSNIGHLESAAGIAGLTKVLLQMKHKRLVPSLHAENLNPHIDFENSPFYVQRELGEWKPRPRRDGGFYPLRAGISSFGAGGANAHIIIEEWRDGSPVSSQTDAPYIIILSARNEERLKASAENLLSFTEKSRINRNEFEISDVSMADMAYTLQVGREPMEERLALLVEDKKELLAKLREYLKTGKEIPGLRLGSVKKDKSSDGLLVEGKEGREFLNIIIEGKNLTKLARLWTSGVDIDWDLLTGRPSPAEFPCLPTPSPKSAIGWRRARPPKKPLY